MRIKAYVESMDSSFKWVMDALQLVPQPAGMLEELLVMKRGSKPFSFPERGLPAEDVLSEGVARRVKESNARHTQRHASWLTREDLIKKSAELLITPEANALKVRSALIGLIQSMGTLTENPRHQRLVFWFHI